MSIFQRLSFLAVNPESPGRISDLRLCCVHLGLDLGRAGNFPWTGGDGSLLESSGPVAAGVLDAAAGTTGVLSIHFFGWPVVPAVPVFLIPLLSSSPPAQGATVGV